MNRHEALGQIFAAVERDDLEFVEAWFEQNAHPEIEFTSALTSGIEGRVCRGKRGLVNWANDVSDAVDIRYGELEFRDVGDDVVVLLVRPSLEGRGSGVQIQLEIGFVIEFDGELARRGASYTSHAEAMRPQRRSRRRQRATRSPCDDQRRGHAQVLGGLAR